MADMNRDPDERVRLSAFEFLSEQTRLRGEVLPRKLLEEGFVLEGTRVPLMGPQGIFKPAILPEIPLSMTTVPVVEGKEPPYEDVVRPDGMISYRYRGRDPSHRDNVGLRLAMTRRTPLVHFQGIVPGEYMPTWPVYIVDDSPQSLTFTVAADAPSVLGQVPRIADPMAEAGRRAYVTRQVQQRMHQHSFRIRVLRAYQERCAICRLKHRELLDAAHIVPDAHPQGVPSVRNGLALCNLHHAAFDRNLLGIRPDFVVELRRQLLDEEDGPMLVHGLQGFQGTRILLPRAVDKHPDTTLLELRFDMFRKAT